MCQAKLVVMSLEYLFVDNTSSCREDMVFAVKIFGKVAGEHEVVGEHEVAGEHSLTQSIIPKTK